MTLDDLRGAKKRTVGTKQTVKALQKLKVRAVYVAGDAEDHITREIVKASREKGIELVHVESMAALGKACGIEVGAATAAVLEE